MAWYAPRIRSGYIYVQNIRACGTLEGVSTTPGSISGGGTVFAGTSITYSVEAVDGEASYAWTLSGGWTGSSNSNSILATAGENGGAVSMVAWNACGTSPSASLGVAATNCVGMEEPQDGEQSISIFTNPNTGEFTIIFRQKGTFALYNSLGQVIRTLQFNASHTTITVTHLQNSE